MLFTVPWRLFIAADILTFTKKLKLTPLFNIERDANGRIFELLNRNGAAHLAQDNTDDDNDRIGILGRAVSPGELPADAEPREAPTYPRGPSRLGDPSTRLPPPPYADAAQVPSALAAPASHMPHPQNDTAHVNWFDPSPVQSSVGPSQVDGTDGSAASIQSSPPPPYQTNSTNKAHERENSDSPMQSDAIEQANTVPGDPETAPSPQPPRLTASHLQLFLNIVERSANSQSHHHEDVIYPGTDASPILGPGDPEGEIPRLDALSQAHPGLIHLRANSRGGFDYVGYEDGLADVHD